MSQKIIIHKPPELSETKALELVISVIRNKKDFARRKYGIAIEHSKSHGADTYKIIEKPPTAN